MPGDCVIGVDLGGTKLLAGVLDEGLSVRARTYRPAAAVDAEAVLAGIEDAVREVLRAADAPVTGVGVGVPCVMDLEHGVARSSVHLPLAGVAVRERLAERLGLPVWVDNDATVAMLAEHRAGAAAGVRTAVMLTLGTGIGGGLVIDGRVFRGGSGGGAELGHVVVDADGPLCPGDCPNRGCLEAFASGRALGLAAERVAAQRPRTRLGRLLESEGSLPGTVVTELAHDGDPDACEVMASVGRWLGIGITGLVNVFDPDVVVVGGGVVAAGDLLLDPAREEVRARALAPLAGRAEIVAARFGEEAGMVGAALLAFDGAAAAVAAP